MQPEEMHKLQQAIGWTNKRLAYECRLQQNYVDQLRFGRYSIPAELAAFLRKLHEAVSSVERPEVKLQVHRAP